MEHPQLSPLQRGAVGYAVMCIVVLVKGQVDELLYGERRMSDEGLTFDEWIWRAELLAAHAAALALLVPMLAGWPMPRWPRRRRKPVLRLVK